jgi:uncharacterized membrane protein HdeD (DUF308 family)
MNLNFINENNALNEEVFSVKKLSLVGKINFVLGIILLLIGILLLIQELKVGFTLKKFPQSISFILIGISIFLSAFFYKKEHS